MKKERESISSGAEKVETLAKRSEAAKEEEKARVRAAVGEIALVENVQNGLCAEHLFKFRVERRRRTARIEDIDYTVAQRDVFLHHPHCLGHMAWEPL